jgi:dimethylargininase
MPPGPKLAITREPGARYRECVSCHPEKATISVERAREQHRTYCSLLEDLGLEVIRMSRDDMNPDSCFVEDTVVVHGRRALMCRPALESRRGEVEAVAELLKDYLELSQARPPATVEGGDVIHFEDRLVSGVTQRTNRAGVQQMAEWLGARIDTVEDEGIVHLKSYATYIGGDAVIASGRFADHEAFRDLEVIRIPEEEAYAADALAIGDVVLMAAGREASHSLVRQAGFEVVSVEVSEFEKCEGAITCLSILL